MKNTILFSFFISVICVKMFAQSENVVVISNEEMNVLYIDYPNQIKIVASESFDSISTSIQSEIEIVSNSTLFGNYTLYPSTPGEVILYVYSGGRVISEKKFRVKPLPIPQLLLYGRYDPSILKNSELKGIEFLGLGAPGFELDFKWRVVSYEVIVMGTEQGKVMVYSGMGNRLSKEVTAAFSRNDIDKVYIDLKVSNSMGMISSIAKKFTVEK